MKNNARSIICTNCIITSRLLNQSVFRDFAFENLLWKDCFVNYLVNKRTLTLKKQVASPER